MPIKACESLYQIFIFKCTRESVTRVEEMLLPMYSATAATETNRAVERERERRDSVKAFASAWKNWFAEREEILSEECTCFRNCTLICHQMHWWCTCLWAAFDCCMKKCAGLTRYASGTLVRKDHRPSTNDQKCNCESVNGKKRWRETEGNKTEKKVMK